MNILSNILAFLFAAGIIIFVHELGHYLVAKACGIRVLTFSLGFGRRLWGVRRGDTDYRVSLVPLGGYVSFAGQDPGSESDDPGAFVNHPRWQRVSILLAGPTMNVLLAVLLVALVFMAGTEIPNRRDVPTEVGTVVPGSAADRAGFAPGDRIVAIDGEPMDDWQEVSMTFLTSPSRQLEVAVEREAQQLVLTVTPERIPRYELGDAGVYPSAPPRVRKVMPGTPAERAGLRFADTLLAVDGRPVSTVEEFSDALAPLAGRQVAITVGREGARLELVATPEEKEGRGMIGIEIGHFYYQRLPPGQAVIESLRYNWDVTREIGSFLGKVFERRISPQSALGGPIEIARFSGEAARAGFRDLLMFMALISLNLFLLNMLPIPILDGGQILILTVEGTLRRDLSVRFKERLFQAGLVVIVLLMVMALYFDVLKTLPSSG